MTRTSRRRLAIELLESREAPSSVTGIPGLDTVQLPGPVQTPILPGPESNQPPVVSDFKAVVGPNHQVTFTGKVTDDQPVAGDLVRITGPGVDVTALVRDDGTFQVTVTVNATGEITVVARATDQAGATSDPAYTTFNP